jgi:hypothetical protein
VTGLTVATTVVPLPSSSARNPVPTRISKGSRMARPREGCLREEFRDWYPSIASDAWYPADELTRLVLDHRRSGTPRWEAAEQRIPSDEHFEFRGGSPRADPAERTRHGDLPASLNY